MSPASIEPQTDSAVPAQAQPDERLMPPRAVMPAVALVSFASLLLELAMTRLFSVVLFYHFAFFAISVALLGLGSGGVFAHVRRQWLLRFGLRPLGAWLCILNAVFILLAIEVVLRTPVTLAVNGRNFGRLTIIYLVTAIPFFFTGLLFSVLFARSRKDIPVLYGADLAGGATACLAVVPLLNYAGAPNALVFAALAMAMAAALWAGRTRIRLAALLLAGMLGALMAANHSGRWIDIVYAKGVLHDPAQTEFAEWNAISRIEVHNWHGSRYILIDADAGTAIMNLEPSLWAVDQSANPDSAQPFSPVGQPGFNWRHSLMAEAPAVANVLRPQGEFAIIGPGGGVDVLRAVANGSPKVTGIEINPAIANSVMRGRYADYTYHLYERPPVEIHVQDGRSYVRNSREKYDVVQMTLVDTWASTAAGAFALSENNLYTVEAFREYFDHLKPSGFIAITRWEFKKPREALRVVSQAMEALHRNGVPDPRRNFVVVADGGLNDDGRPVLVLAKKSEFTAAEYSAVARHVQANPNLVWLNPPEGYAGAQALPPAAAVFRELIESNDPWKFARTYAYNVAPVDDGAPFFFFTLKTGYVIGNIVAGTGQGIDWKVNLGVVVLGMVLIISLVAVVAFLILPLLLAGKGADRKVSAGGLSYFVAVGLGYILVEISLIQRFVLFLGHPTYALTVVVFLMLLSSGIGSVLAGRLQMRMRRALMFIVAMIAVHAALLPLLLPAAVGQAFAVKLLISAAVLVPLGLLMGMPFPLGLKRVAAEDGSTVEWAWAMNAAASVLGSVAAMVIAIHFGLTVTLACAALAYLLAAGFSQRWNPRAAA